MSGPHYTAEQYAQARANNWTDDDLRGMGITWDPPPQHPEGSKVGTLLERATRGMTGNPLIMAGRIAASATPQERLLGNGAFSGFTDRARALIKAIRPDVTYDDALREEQAKTQQARKDVGEGTALATEMIGGMTGPVGLVGDKAARMLPGVGRLPAFMGRIAGATAGGAVGGALGGAGNAPPGEVLPDALNGLKTGAAFGAGIGGLGEAARGAARYFGLFANTGGAEKASKAVGTVVHDAGYDTPEAYAAANVRPGASGRAVADFDRNTQELARDVSRSAPDVEASLDKFSHSRKAAQGEAVASDFRSALGAKNIDPQQQIDQLGESLRNYEGRVYPKLFKKHPNPVQDPAMIKAWQTAERRLSKFISSLPAEQELADEPLKRVLQNVKVPGTTQMVQDGLYSIPVIGSAETQQLPTLEGLHKFKMSFSGVRSALLEKYKNKTITGAEVRTLRSLNAFNKRFRDLISQAEGGGTYDEIQALGARVRGQQDAIREGGELLGRQMSPYDVSQSIAQAESRAGQKLGKPSLRIGAAGSVDQKLHTSPEDAAALLKQLATTGQGDDVVRQLAPSPDRAARFSQAMQDRLRMAETDAAQLGRATPQKEILPGAKMRSTALQFGEAGGLGALLQGKSPLGMAGLAAGSLLAKVLQGRRYRSTEEAARILNGLLQKAGDDPTATADLVRLYGLLQSLNTARQGAAGAMGAGVGAVFGQPDQ